MAPKSDGDDELQMHGALEEIGNSGASFLVAVRIDAAARVRTLSDILVPQRYVELFSEIPEYRFRLDTSSSAIRARGRAGHPGIVKALMRCRTSCRKASTWVFRASPF